jgi:hypothetical protein
VAEVGLRVIEVDPFEPDLLEGANRWLQESV